MQISYFFVGKAVIWNPLLVTCKITYRVHNNPNNVVLGEVNLAESAASKHFYHKYSIALGYSSFIKVVNRQNLCYNDEK
jgi:hypothetical protein